MKLFKILATAVIGASAVSTAHADVVKHKIKLGGGSAYWGGHPSFAVVKINSINEVNIYHTTNTVDQLLGTGKWWDHPVIASRACIITDEGWDDANNCINGEKGVIKLPPGANHKQYTFEIKWKESGAIQHAKFGIR